MLRETLLQHEPVDGFRWRSREVSRIEGFSDAVFGFAVTLLIVSLEVPRTSTELLATMRGFGAFVITFVMLTGIWRAQYTFFRRYGLEDRTTVTLNLALLFTVLFFVYPLKFLFGVLLSNVHMAGMVETSHGLVRVVLPEHKKWIFVIFAIGYTAVFGVFAALYHHAYRQRERLDLNEFEVYETKHSVRRMLVTMCIGVTYFAVAFTESMPERTPEERRLAIIVSVAMFAVFAGLIGTLVRWAKHRRRVRDEWTSRTSGTTGTSGTSR